MKSKKWLVGIYTRISREDDLIESNSISNQKKLIDYYIIQDNNMKIVEYYTDNGYSGTNFNRPAFLKMYNDIKKKKINTIIVKDLSRLGRNYIELGKYLEQIFPLYNLRIISINDNIDSYKNPSSLNNIFVPFKNLMNDAYARDISLKVKSVLRMKMLNGEYIGSIPPYGYIRNKLEKNKLIIDYSVAYVIILIFDLAKNNYSYKKISEYLNDLKIPSPSSYRSKKQKNSVWCSSTIRSILNNRVYCGDLIQAKTHTINHKIKKSIKNNPNDFIVISNNHDAIISKKLFNEVQTNINYKRKKINKKYKKNIFSGYLKCLDCGYSMKKIKAGFYNKKEDFYFYCSTYQTKSKNLCTPHRIRYSELQNKVLEELKNKLPNIKKITTSILEELIKTIYIDNNSNISIIYKDKIHE